MSKFLEELGIFTTEHYAYAVKDGVPEVLTCHPKTGKIVPQSSIRWPQDFPIKEVARNLRAWYGQKEGRARAVALGAWEAAMLLEERLP